MHSVEADTTYTLQDRINQLNEYIKNLQNDNAKLANEKAEIASKRADLNKRNKDLTNAHVSNLQSIAKRVVEKDEVRNQVVQVPTTTLNELRLGF